MGNLFSFYCCLLLLLFSGSNVSKESPTIHVTSLNVIIDRINSVKIGRAPETIAVFGLYSPPANKYGDRFRMPLAWKFELSPELYPPPPPPPRRSPAVFRIRLTSANGSGTGGGQKQEEYGEKSPAPATEEYRHRHSRHSRDKCRGCQNTSAFSPLISICLSRRELPVHTRIWKKKIHVTTHVCVCPYI